jgi:hypothetical protein
MITLTDAFNPQNATRTFAPLQEGLSFEKPISGILVVLSLQAIVCGGWIWPVQPRGDVNLQKCLWT